MPCNWSTTASFLLRHPHFNIPQRTKFFSPALPVGTRARCHTSLHRGLSTRSFASTVQAPQTDTPPSEPPLSSLSSAVALLTPAQLSRTAAKTVRICISEHDFGDALYVVNSACHSVLYSPLRTEPEGESHAATPSQLEPINFGRPVSPRLAAHAFLHGLVRGGYTRKASTFASLMMQAGISIRVRTLESIVASTSSSPSTIGKLGPFARVIPRRVLRDENVLQLHKHQVQNEETHAVLELLHSARTFGQQRTSRMYRVLIGTLLMQGEIIVASLLFVLLAKDWQLRRAQEGAAQQAATDAISYDGLALPRPSYAALLAAPYPDLDAMNMITTTIYKRTSLTSDHAWDPKLYQYLQSLAIFAMLLDTGQIPTHRLSGLIRTMYKCPKSKLRVWIWRDGKPVFVEAHWYIHDVLTRLINSMDSEHIMHDLRLTRKAYNTLLSYALRQRLSPDMASKVLQHMCVKRSPPIPPDIVTYNILLRSGTLLRQLSISEAALTALRSATRDAGVSATPLDGIAPLEDTSRSSDVEEAAEDVQNAEDAPATTTQPSPSSDEAEAASDFSVVLAKLQAQHLNLPPMVTSPTQPLGVNKHTLTSFVAHLVSTGRPDVVASILFDILPELHIIDHPATNGVARRPMNKLSRRSALRNAVKHGPYVYTTIINALAKAGEIGLAERVFILAQQAETASRIPDFAPVFNPWTLPKHAYTSLMQCYANFARGHVPKHNRDRRHLGAAMLEHNPEWSPKAKHHHAGFAQYIHLSYVQRSATSRPGYTRRQTARRNAMLLYRSMLSGGRALLRSLIIIPRTSPTRTSPAPARPPSRPLPNPDARFFNAALRLFATPPRVRALSVRESILRAHSRRAPVGPLAPGAPPQCTTALRIVARAMVAHGYDVPRAYRALLTNQRVRVPRGRRRRRDVVRSPYAFPRPPGPEAQGERTIPTVKERGLPVRRRKPVWARRRTRAGAVVGRDTGEGAGSGEATSDVSAGVGEGSVPSV